MESRVIELEIRYTHQAELLRELSDVLTAQQKTIERLERRVHSLERKLAAQDSGH